MRLFTAQQLRIIKRTWKGDNAEQVAYTLDMPVDIVTAKLAKLPKDFLQISIDAQKKEEENSTGKTKVHTGGKKYQTVSHTERGRWERWEDAYLTTHFEHKSPEALADYLGRTVLAIQDRARYLGVSPQSNKGIKKQPVERPPAVYSNRNTRQELLDKYAPLND